MSKYKNQQPFCFPMNFSFTACLKLFRTSYSTKILLLVSTFHNNTIITGGFFCICNKNIARGLSTDRAWEVDSITECNIAVQIEKPVIIIFTSRELKRHHFAMASFCD